MFLPFWGSCSLQTIKVGTTRAESIPPEKMVMSKNRTRRTFPARSGFARFGLFVQSAVRLAGLLQSLVVPPVPVALTSTVYFTPDVRPVNMWVAAVPWPVMDTAPGVFGVQV